jgi:hypothetical protein
MERTERSMMKAVEEADKKADKLIQSGETGNKE